MQPRFFAAAAAVVLALALSGCTTGSPAPDETESAAVEPSATASAPTTQETDTGAVGLDEDALERVTQAAANTADAGTARFDLTITTEGTGGADGQQPVSVTGEEDFDARQRALTFAGPQGELEVVVDDTDVYVQVPATEDEDWARIELDALLQDDVGFGGVGGLPFQSPQDNLAVLEDAVTAAAEAGEEDVRGEQSTRYDLTVDLEAAAGQSAEDTRPGLLAAAQESGITELDMQVWVDAEDRISRISYSVDLSQADTGEVESELASEDIEADVAQPAGQVAVDVEYYDYGADLTIEIPAEADVVDIDEDEILDSFGQ